MPIGRTCRSCGADLPADLRWCGRCYAPVQTFAPRPPIHAPGTFVGTPTPDVKTSRWRAGPTTMGPLGRLGWTVGLLLFFPWWALVVPLLSIWRKERVAPDAPPTLIERFRERHPTLGTEFRVGPTARLLVVLLAGLALVAVFLTKQGADRYLFGAPILAGGLMIALARWNDL